MTLPTFETTVHKTDEWVNDMQAALAWPADRQDAYHVLRAGLHFLRDRLTVEENANFSAQLPMLVRGIFYEGWHPADKPLKINDYDQMAAYLGDAIDRDISSDPGLVLRALFSVLQKHVTAGELDDVKSMLPKSMHELWPDKPLIS